MALCDFLITADIQGYDCENPMVKGAKADGLLINRKEINLGGVTYDANNPFKCTALPLLQGKTAYDIVQGGKTPYTGSQQEMQEGTYQNTITNTVQFGKIFCTGFVNIYRLIQIVISCCRRLLIFK